MGDNRTLGLVQIRVVFKDGGCDCHTLSLCL